LTIEANVENAGLLEGTGNQGLVLSFSVTNSATGVITAGNGSSVTLNDVTGGTLTTAGTGVIDVVDGAILKSLTNTGLLAPQTADVGFYLVGTIDNTGSITLAQQADEIEVEQGNLTLTGDGDVEMTGEDDGISGSYIFDNDGNTISGDGVIGDGTTTLIGTTSLVGLTVHNVAGIISANDGGTLSIDTGSSTIVNDATLVANPGSDLYLDSPVSNSGVLDANDGSITAADAVTGGTATITDFGEIEFGAASNATVKFVSGAQGVLILDAAVQYTGTIVGFNASQAIDLTDIPKTATMSFSAGVLTINGGPGDVAHLHFAGSFTLSEFSLAPDGGNGSILTDPPAGTNAANATNIALLGSYIASLFASVEGSVSAQSTEAVQNQTVLAHPHAA